MNYMKPLARHLVLPDVHVPFQDDPAVAAWLRFSEGYKPDVIHVIGDVLDCYTLSRFDKNPARKSSIQDEADAASILLTEVRRLNPNAAIHFSEGNHEARLRTTLWGPSKVLAPIRGLTIPALLDLPALGIKWHPSSVPYLVHGNLWCTHGDIARKSNWSMTHGGAGASAVMRRIGGSVIMGHTHSMGMSFFRHWDRPIEGYECGSICRFDMEYLVALPAWHTGWATIDTFPGGIFQVEFVRVVDGPGKHRSVLWRGTCVDRIARSPRLVGGGRIKG